MTIASKPPPRRGEIWFTKLYVDPPGKGPRPVLIVSTDARNRHEGVDTVLAIPLTTSIHKDFPTHVMLPAGETGLSADSAARAEDITVILKADLIEPRSKLRQISNDRICQMARAVNIAVGCIPTS